jgi:LacI family repressor for deo operon, udp, cdd, tsx, nupC, and nupG
MALLAGATVPSAIFCFSDQMALGVLAACRDLGIRVPDALSVVGFDDLASSSYLTPALTTVRQPMREIGERAVNLLLAIIEGVDVPLQQTLEFSLMVRGSTAAYCKQAVPGCPTLGSKARPTR